MIGKEPRGRVASALLPFIFAGLPAGSALAEGETVLEEVTVTAQRVAESIQDVPIAVTAISGDMLEEKQVITVSDLQMNHRMEGSYKGFLCH